MYGIVVFDVILQIALAVVISKSRENCIKGGRESSQIYLEVNSIRGIYLFIYFEMEF